MLILNPRVVLFDGLPLPEVALVAVDRKDESRVVEWSEQGPHPTFADVPRTVVEVRVVQRMSGEDPGSLVPGRAGSLVFTTARSAGSGQRRRAHAHAVLLSCLHELSVDRGTTRTLRFIAISSDGSSDPLTFTDAPGSGS